MARVVRIFKTLRNHWKKSTVGFCLLAYGGNWAYGKYCDNMLRRAACQEAQVFGNELIYPNMAVKKATVFLNPAACKGKARSLFEKNAAPILHLAGIDVTVVKTDYEGQAKKLLDVMKHTDLIIVAGGDGTLQEVITGLLRRADQASFSKIPIGFIPLGATNSLSHTLFPQTDNKVQHISEATLSILKGETIKLDVLQIKGDQDQAVLPVNGLRWGSYETQLLKLASKYWYLGPLKARAAHMFSTLKDWPQRHQASIMYLGPTERPPEESDEKPARAPLYIRIYRRLAQYWAPPKVEVPVEETPVPWEEAQLSAIELSFTTQNHQPNLLRTMDSMSICIEPDTIGKGDFIRLGTQKINDPLLCPKDSQVIQASHCSLQLPEGTEGHFSIDSEEYEAMSVEVTLLPRKLQFLCHPTRKQQLSQNISEDVST
ncbi:LOW QUALITY PROTEIN: acylglycerol kinase, mitochondrial [Bombina bombina]|uniref:LOW QUALITY PROTEIN: acylglycerol kinase, mitochondrial n=1 Tax=Bombina bombina TaxID=8345 RepID=UPI00235A739A|nr:LOW QUALITY PROTEIN: acylglycerol kinase, mitochondrial [Bombina bombina]